MLQKRIVSALVLVTSCMLPSFAPLGQAQEVTQSIQIPTGQTLDSVPKRHVIAPEISMRTIRVNWDNPISDQQLGSIFPYKAKKGEQLSQLAQKYNTSELDILALNHTIKEKLDENKIIFIPANIATAGTESSKNTSKPADKNNKTKLSSKYTTSIAGKQVTGTLTMRATAYGYNGNGAWGNKTARGNTVRPGIIAVDPRVIPLGTKVFVSGYSSPFLPAGGFVAIADDTGGAIKGNRIDIFIPKSESQVSSFGIQKVTVKILK